MTAGAKSKLIRRHDSLLQGELRIGSTIAAKR
jgi:hypothetical protein